MVKRSWINFFNRFWFCYLKKEKWLLKCVGMVQISLLSVPKSFTLILADKGKTQNYINFARINLSGIITCFFRFSRQWVNRLKWNELKNWGDFLAVLKTRSFVKSSISGNLQELLEKKSRKHVLQSFWRFLSHNKSWNKAAIDTLKIKINFWTSN